MRTFAIKGINRRFLLVIPGRGGKGGEIKSARELVLSILQAGEGVAILSLTYPYTVLL